MKTAKSLFVPGLLLSVCALEDVAVCTDFRRGDADQSGSLDIGDAAGVLTYLFSGGNPLLCLEAADANDNGGMEVSDAVQVLLYLFGGGSPLPEPFSNCGPDPTPDALSCDAFPGCVEDKPFGDFLPLEALGPYDCAIEDSTFQSTGGGCKDSSTSLVWVQGGPVGAQSDWSFAVTLCNGLETGGFLDWRLPTVAELQDMAADSNYLHLQLEPGSGYVYWSSQDRGNQAWGVFLDSGGATNLATKSSGRFVLCVRQESPPSPVCGNGVCEAGEDCHSCPGDCPGRAGGPPSKRHCCGDGVLQAPEAADPTLCDGNN